jgi:tetratricopeptide (TPR) repeat protein
MDLPTAIACHQAGRLEEAAHIYEDLLARQPNHIDVLHLLGVLAHQRGQHDRAVELIARAIALDPSVPAFHANLAEAYRALGQLERAGECSRAALQLQPDYPEAANNLGLALAAQGKTDEALAQFRHALRLRPDFALAHNNLGSALGQARRFREALEHFREAVRLAPDMGQAHSNLGQALLETHQPGRALVHCRRAVELRPDLAEGHTNLGNVLRKLGRLAEARAAYAEASRLNPDLAMAHNNMGQLLQQEGRLDEAFLCYQQSLALDPESARAHANLGSLLYEQDRTDLARSHYEAALRSDPNHAEAHGGLGLLRAEEGSAEAAIACYRTALCCAPDLAAAHTGLGSVLEEQGDLAGALAAYRQALAHQPDHAGAYALLATALRGRLPGEEYRAARALLAQPGLSDSDRFNLHYGLALVLDARGEYTEAAAHVERAAALRKADQERRRRGYDRDLHARFVDDLLATFTPEWFDRARSLGSDSQRPVFVFGLPRSGTTLVEQVLASHPQVFGAGELPWGRDAFDRLAGPESGTPRALAQLDSSRASQEATRYLRQLSAVDSRATHVVDKMPDNYLYLGLLAVLFPRAHFIHCRRDLRDLAVSCWMTNFRHIRWACDPDDLAARFRDYLRLAEHWQKVLPVSVLEVRYEDMVANLEGTARRLLEWCGLPWEPACLAFHSTRRLVRTASVTQVRQPLYRHAVGRWRNYAGPLGALFAQLPEPAPQARP